MKIIQVLSPYSATDPQVKADPVRAAAHRQLQYERTRAYCAELMGQGFYPISPVVSNHDLAACHDVPTDFAFWQHYCFAIMERVDEVHVLCIEGWKESVGVKAEIDHARALGLTVVYHEPD